MIRPRQIAGVVAGFVVTGMLGLLIMPLFIASTRARAAGLASAPTEETPGAVSSPGGAENGPPGAGMIAVKKLSNEYCQALAPDGWRITDSDHYGTTFDLASPDGVMKASYGSLGISADVQNVPATVEAMRQLACSEGLPSCKDLSQLTPEQMGVQYQQATSSVQYVVNLALGGSVHFDAAPQPQRFEYQLLNFTGDGFRGFVLYRAYKFSAGTALLMRLAVGSADPSDRTVAIAGAVATSIECHQQLRPPPPHNPSTYHPGEKPPETATSTKCQVWSPNCNDADFAGSYNPQLGIGYVHSESCQNFMASPDSDKWETGPDGPGYYRKIGGNMVKLLPGRCD
jgi:hypothetical protein